VSTSVPNPLGRAKALPFIILLISNKRFIEKLELELSIKMIYYTIHKLTFALFSQSF
jgi:hypothetical protein